MRDDRTESMLLVEPPYAAATSGPIPHDDHAVRPETCHRAAASCGYGHVDQVLTSDFAGKCRRLIAELFPRQFAALEYFAVNGHTRHHSRAE